MIKMLVTFVSLFLILYFGIDMFRQVTGKQKWTLVKTFTYAGVVSLLTFAILTFIVVLF